MNKCQRWAGILMCVIGILLLVPVGLGYLMGPAVYGWICLYLILNVIVGIRLASQINPSKSLLVSAFILQIVSLIMLFLYTGGGLSAAIIFQVVALISLAISVYQRNKILK